VPKINMAENDVDDIRGARSARKMVDLWCWFLEPESWVVQVLISLICMCIWREHGVMT